MTLHIMNSSANYIDFNQSSSFIIFLRIDLIKIFKLPFLRLKIEEIKGIKLTL